MGDAKRRQQTLAASPALSFQEQQLLGQAMREVVGAITSFHGSDCMSYAAIGAKALEQLGFPAKMVCGSAAWRVGPGDGDVISHASEVGAPAILPLTTSSNALTTSPNVKAGMFHAWIEVGPWIVDFTTAALADKAHILDKLDGGTTLVQWAPEVLWVDRNTCSNFDRVVNGFNAGVYGYRRREDIERALMVEFERDFDFGATVPAVLAVYNALKAGHRIQVHGVDSDGLQTLDTATQKARNATRAPWR